MFDPLEKIDFLCTELRAAVARSECQREVIELLTRHIKAMWEALEKHPAEATEINLKTAALTARIKELMSPHV